MNPSKARKLINAALVLLSFAALALLYVSSRPPGLNGQAYSRLMNSGRISDVHGLIISAESHARLLPFEQSALWAALILLMVLAVFNLLQSRLEIRKNS
jgi:hypothetical protein